ncbi:unnamed protein product [Peniophora sp. CBMAI 1063]|nr:unnamed protein product [Peniophora sp. CBMAI 1063]
MALDEASMHRLGLGFVYRIIPVIIVSILYGIYIAILCVATRGLLERGLKARANLYVLLAIWLLFLFTSTLWSLELAQLIGLDEILLSPDGLSPDSLFNRFYNLVARETKVTGVLFQSQMILGDILVIWRASAIWHDRRAVVFLPLFWWVLMIVNLITNASLCESGVATTKYSKVCKATDILAPTLSIMVNLSVMILIIWKAWIMREVLLTAYRNKRHNKILSLFVLLIESGTLYVCALVSDLLVTSYVTGNNETIQRMISCISGYTTVQFVGIYPTLMFVMLRESVWNSQDDVQSSLPSGRGAEVFTITVGSQMQFASRAQRDVERDVPLGLGNASETGSSTQGDLFHATTGGGIQEKEKAPMLSGLAL